MDTAGWPQTRIGLVKRSNSECVPREDGEVSMRRSRTPQKDETLSCPRCSSTNTKFCYYNNYSLSQPRYFCKTCRRYWTNGGSLRNVPVGGGSRKNKRSNSSAHKRIHKTNLLPPNYPPTHHVAVYAGQDLNLSYPPPQQHAAQNTVSSIFGSTGFGLRGREVGEYKPELNFLLGGLGYGEGEVVQDNVGGDACRLLFPFEDLKQDVCNEGGNSSNGGCYWNGMLLGNYNHMV